MPSQPTTPAEGAKLAELAEAAERVRQIEAELNAAVERRNELLIAYHGDHRNGGLTYRQLATAVGMSQGWVVQLVQGRSEWSRQQIAKSREARAPLTPAKSKPAKAEPKPAKAEPAEADTRSVVKAALERKAQRAKS